jgi:hypothetical protein
MKRFFAIALLALVAGQSYAVAWDQARHVSQSLGFALSPDAHLDDGSCIVCQDHQPAGHAPVRVEPRFDLLPVERDVASLPVSFLSELNPRWNLSRGPPVSAFRG